MKVLHLVHNYYPSVGGSQLVIQKVSEGLVQTYGDTVSVLTTNALKSPSSTHNELVPSGEELVNGVRVRRFEFWRRPLPIIKRFVRRLPRSEYLEPFTYGPYAPAMALEALREDADVVAAMSFPFLHMYYPQRRSRPLVMFGALHIRGARIAAPIVRAIAGADAYVAFTEYEKAALVRHGIDGRKLHVVGLGVDLEPFARADGRAIRARLGIGDAPVVGFIGRQASYKGCDTLVHAMTTVWDRFPDARLVLAGARTAFSDELDRIIAALPAAKRGRVIVANDFTNAEKPDWFAACDVVVCTSSDESFGLVFIEGWAAGKPVIGGRIGAVECVISHGHDGLLVPVGDARELAVAIERLLRDDMLRERMGHAGREKVRAEYHWPRVVEKVRAIYETTVHSAGTK